MRFVDEFRSREAAARLAAEIAERAGDRPFQLMEVCGGHTHAIYKHGVEDWLPESLSLVHGPGCPVCVIPMGRVDDALSLAERPEVTLAIFGDMLRVPGSRGSLLEARARGADVRVVYSPLDALALARREPGRRVVFLALGFETTAPSTALTLVQARRERVSNFSVFCNHVTILPALKALLDSPDLRLDGFIGPGHVSTVIGWRPYEFVPQRYGKPLVVAGFEPLDVLQAISMLLRQLREGRAEVENQYARVVSAEGNPRALRAIHEVMELRPHFEWRGLGFIAHSALRLREAYADHDAERLFDLPGVRVADPKACQCGEVLKGALRPWQCKVFGTACTPETPIGSCMVSSEGACAAYYNYGRFERAVTGDPDDPRRRALERIARTQGRRPRLRDERITLAHGAGGRAMRTLVEALFLEAFRNPLLEPLEDQAVLDVKAPRLAFTTDGYVVTPLFFPGGSIGDLAVNGTVNDLAVCGARPLFLSAGFILEEGFPIAELRRIALAMQAAAVAAGVQIVTGDTKVVERGKGDGCYVSTAGVGVIERPLALGAREVRPGDAVLVSGPIAEHGVAILLARGELALEADVRSDTAPLAGLVQDLLDAAPGVRCLRDVTRGGVATVANEIAAAAGVAIQLEEAQVPVREAVAGACELLGIDPLHVACEGRLLAVVAPDAADAALAALRAHPAGAGAARIGSVRDEPRGMVLLRTGFGGTRVLDMLIGHPLPRIC